MLVHKKRVETVVFHSVQKMMLRKFYVIRTNKASDISQSQCHLLDAIKNNWLEGPINLLAFWFVTQESFPSRITFTWKRVFWTIPIQTPWSNNTLGTICSSPTRKTARNLYWKLMEIVFCCEGIGLETCMEINSKLSDYILSLRDLHFWGVSR